MWAGQGSKRARVAPVRCRPTSPRALRDVRLRLVQPLPLALLGARRTTSLAPAARVPPVGGTATDAAVYTAQIQSGGGAAARVPAWPANSRLFFSVLAVVYQDLPYQATC